MDQSSSCIIEGCTRTIRNKSKGWCGTHYQRWLRNGDPLAAREYGRNDGPCEIEGCARPAETKKMCTLHYQRSLKGQDMDAPVPEITLGCAVEGCPEPHHGKGYCNTHHIRWRRTGDPGVAEKLRVENEGKTCEGPECDRPAISRGFCGSHYYQHSNGLPLAPIKQYKPKGVPCEVVECQRKSVSEGLCRTHYGRKVKGEADWDRPIAAKAPDGDGHLDENGYRVITHEGRKRPEHCVFVEKLLRRPLDGFETVHHRNGNRSDNRTDGPLRLVNGKLQSGNLELWSSKQPAGQEIGPKLDWAVEILEEYAEYLPGEYRVHLAAMVKGWGYRFEGSAA